MPSDAAIRNRTRKAGIVRDPRFWATSAGYEFQANWGNGDTVAALAATNDGLQGYGWGMSNGVSVVEGTAGDFLSAADITPTYSNVDGVSGQIYWSPRVFGSYSHALQASRYLGYMPTKLSLECFAALTNQNTNFEWIGFSAAAVTDITGVGQVAGICSDGTNFRLKSDLGNDAGAAGDTNWHTFRIEVSSGTTEWFIDGTSQGTITTETDIWPTTVCVSASGAGLLMKVSWLRVYYE